MAVRARRLPPEQRRESLIAATLPLVLRHGPSVTTRQIAEAADVAEGTIFRVFEDKEALIGAVVARAMDPSQTLCELAAVDRARPLHERLEVAVDIVQRRLVSVFGVIDALGLQPPRDTRHRTMNDDFHAALADVVGDDRESLRVPPLEVAAALRLLTFSATHPRISDGNPMTPREIVGIVLDGLLDRSAPVLAPQAPLGGNTPC